MAILRYLVTVSSPHIIHKSPLKWAGGKRRLVSHISKLLPKNKSLRLIEPFVGGGSVFLNLPYKNTLLVDSNPDLIGLFKAIQTEHKALIAESSKLFEPHYNVEKVYYELRAEFNHTQPSLRRWALFLYMNRHGYNGLCRYNQKGLYNVPFGKYKRPYFPEAEIRYFSDKVAGAELMSADFSSAFELAKEGDVIYCDPPYMPIGKTASFTAYSGTSFTSDDQQRLADLASQAKTKGVTTILSNHYLDSTLALYKNADKIIPLNVARTISCKGSVRKPIKELMAIYKA